MVNRSRYQVRNIAVRLRLVPYRPAVFSSQRWDELYRSDDSWIDRSGTLPALAHYLVLAGYVGWIGRPSVLDLGCGEGLLREHLDPRHFSGYVGVDPTAVAIERASALANEHTRFVLGDPLEASLEPADVVVCCEVLYHVAEPERLVERAIALINPGGYLLTSIFHHAGARSLWQHIDRRLVEVDAVELRNNVGGRRRWRVAMHQKSGEIVP